jgi:ketosteroid isomerase-like protein
MNRAFGPILAIAMVAMSAIAQAAPADRASVAAFKASFMEALAANDIAAIERHLAPDWRIIEAQGQRVTRKDLIAILRSGELKYRSFAARDLDIRLYGPTAIVTGHALVSGAFDGKPFSSDEILSEVLVVRDGRWLCVLSQVTTYQP